MQRNLVRSNSDLDQVKRELDQTSRTVTRHSRVSVQADRQHVRVSDAYVYIHKLTSTNEQPIMGLCAYVSVYLYDAHFD